MIPVFQVNDFLFVNLYHIADLSISSPPHGINGRNDWKLSMSNGNSYLLTADEASTLAACLGSWANMQNQTATTNRGATQ